MSKRTINFTKAALDSLPLPKSGERIAPAPPSCALAVAASRVAIESNQRVMEQLARTRRNIPDAFNAVSEALYETLSKMIA